MEKSLLVFPTRQLTAVKDDPDDNKFVEAALEGKAQYIISQDRHLVDMEEYRGIKILRPDRFLALAG